MCKKYRAVAAPCDSWKSEWRTLGELVEYLQWFLRELRMQLDEFIQLLRRSATVPLGQLNLSCYGGDCEILKAMISWVVDIPVMACEGVPAGVPTVVRALQEGE